MLVGLPGSGKSTYTNDVWMAYRPDIMDTVILSTDYYIDRYAKEQNRTYNDVFNEYVKEAHSLMYEALDFAISNNKNIVWDQTNLNVKTRKNKLNKIPSHYERRAVYFPIPLETALERNTRDGKIIPEYVLKSMSETIEPPTVEEGFDYVYYFSQA